MLSSCASHGIIFPNGGINPNEVTLVLHAYFDESGKFHDTPFICLAGYVACNEQWEQFSDAWAGLLGKHGIPYLHMKDFMARRGVYEETGWSETQRDSVLKEFIHVIRRHVMAAFCIGFDAAHFRSLPRDKQLSIGKDPFFLCFYRLVTRVVDTLIEKGIKDRLVMAFDDDQDSAMRTYRLWCEMKKHHPDIGKRISAVSYADDTVFQPLQAADLLAHATHRFMRDSLDQRAPHPLFAELLESPRPGFGIEYITEIWDEEGIDKWISSHPRK